jgi:hypothetical protein
MEVKSTISRLKGRLFDGYYAHKKQLILGGLIFWVALLSFAMGYLANRDSSRIPIVIEKRTP